MELSKITVRTMRESDLNAVSELAMLANPFATKEKYYKHLLNELREKPDLSLVAIKNMKIVGYVQAEVHNDEAVLEDIAVAKEYQGKGIGTRLLKKELKALKQKGGRIVLAEVHNTMIYTNLEGALFQADCEFTVRVARTLHEACKLVEARFDYVTDMDNGKIFRRRKWRCFVKNSEDLYQTHLGGDISRHLPQTPLFFYFDHRQAKKPYLQL